MNTLDFIKKARESGWSVESVKEEIKDREEANEKRSIVFPYESLIYDIPSEGVPIIIGSREEWEEQENERYKKREKEFDELEAAYADD